MAGHGVLGHRRSERGGPVRGIRREQNFTRPRQRAPPGPRGPGRVQLASPVVKGSVRRQRRAGLTGLVTVLVLTAAAGGLSVGDAVLLGLVEGITEYLPVSSTGHLTVVSRLLGIGTTAAERTAADAYAIVIQAGAILAVLVLYRARVRLVLDGVFRRDPAGRRLLAVLAAGFVPAAAVGFFLGDLIQANLFGVGPVAGAWIAGGLLILAVARRWHRPEGRQIEDLTVRDGLVVGVAQILALWPGVSRSLVTILAAMGLGIATPAAVELSFLLGVVTLGAATGYEAARNGGEIVATFGIAAPAVGFVVAFVSAVAAIRWLVGYVSNHPLTGFGWYRIAIGVAAVGLLAAGVV